MIVMGWEKMWDGKKWVDVYFEEFKTTATKVGSANSNVTPVVVLYGPDGRPLITKKPGNMGFRK